MLQQEEAEVVRLGSACKQRMTFVKDLQATLAVAVVRRETKTRASSSLEVEVKKLSEH